MKKWYEGKTVKVYTLLSQLFLTWAGAIVIMLLCVAALQEHRGMPMQTDALLNAAMYSGVVCAGIIVVSVVVARLRHVALRRFFTVPTILGLLASYGAMYSYAMAQIARLPQEILNPVWVGAVTFVLIAAFPGVLLAVKHYYTKLEVPNGCSCRI